VTLADVASADAPVADVVPADVPVADVLVADVTVADVAAAGLLAAERPDAPAPPDSVVTLAPVGEPASSALAATGSAMVAPADAAASAAAAAGSAAAGDWPASHPVDAGAEPQPVRTVVFSQAAPLPVPALPLADFEAGGATTGRCSIVDAPEQDGRGADGADGTTAISSATRSSAARMIEGSGVSAAGLIEPMRAPAEAAVEEPAGRAACSGRVGALVSDRHRSSHSSVVPPHPLT
jgi:hypothetical protein